MMKFYHLFCRPMVLVFLLAVANVAVAQETRITGKVTSGGDGTPLPGVSILEKGTNNGSVTDGDGNYSINVNPNAVLVFSFIGYKAQEVNTAGRGTVDVVMDEDVATLEEVVVVGYGVQTKREVTGSISKVNGSQLSEVSVPSFEAGLQGRAAGVQVIQGSGVAGSASMIRIRGIASLSAGGDPLYVVDGIPISQDYFINGDRNAFNNNPLASINPNDIESIEILKDASAAAIYGSRGANGVIIITTKRGTTGKPTFEFSTKLGISQPARKLDLLNSKEWLALYQEAWENDGNVGPASLPGGVSWEDAMNTNTDWIDLTTQTGFKQEYNLSMSQGTKKLNTYIGLSYSDNESFLVGNAYRRLSGRANLDYQILPNLKTSLSTSLSQGTNKRVDSGWSGGLGAAMSEALPIYPVYTSTGEFFTDGSNPVSQRFLKDLRSIENRSISTIAINYDPIKDLSINLSGSLDYMDFNDYELNRAIPGSNAESTGRRYPSWVTNYNSSLTASYKLNLDDLHKFVILAGVEFQKSTTKKYNSITAYNINAPLYENPVIPAREENGVSLANPVYESAADQVFSFISYFGRVNYTLKDKLFVKASARVDGSSKFGRNNRYGFFPSMGVGYLISEEEFFDNVPVINFLKLKASWGVTGNADIPNYERWGSFLSREGDDGNPYNQQSILYPVRLENPNLKWEVQRTIDVGFEAGFIDDRIVAEFAYFNKNSTDVLIDRLVQLSSGFPRYFENIAEINNKGIELSLKTRNFVREFTWSTEINISKLKNEVIDIGATPPDAIAGAGDTRVVEGLPVGANFLNRFSRVDPENGLPIFLDKEGNETYEFNLEDRVAVGSVVPDWTGGITNTFAYKNFDLNVLFTFTIGGNIYDDAAKRQLGVVSNWNMRRDIVDRWQKPGDIAEFPRLTLNSTTYGGLPSFWNLNTTQFLYDATYGRLKNVTLGYNFPSSSFSTIGLKGVRLYINATNLLTFTKYPGADPEIVRDHSARQGRNLSPNVTYLTAPQERAFIFGVNVKF